MATFSLRYVARPEILKAVDLTYLRQLLEPYKACFAGRGLDVTVTDEEDFDYDRLSSILMLPDDSTPAKREALPVPSA